MPWVHDEDEVPGTASGGGAGLGLAVSRGLAELLGGDIRARFPKEGGSAFTPSLPRTSS